MHLAERALLRLFVRISDQPFELGASAVGRLGSGLKFCLVVGRRLFHLRFDFLKVIENTDNHKQAIFQYIGPRYYFGNSEDFIGDGETFLYSYTNRSEINQPDGEIVDEELKRQKIEKFKKSLKA